MIKIHFDGFEYDITKWVKKHPGGEHLLVVANGRDITEVVRSHHTFDEIIGFPGIVKLGPCKLEEPSFTFSKEYRKLQQKILQGPKAGNELDVFLWLALFVYLCNINPVVSGVMLIVLGGFGHQYVHSSNPKGAVLTLTGFASMWWRGIHVFGHHPWTNTTRDPDFVDFSTINTYPGAGFYGGGTLRFIVVTLVIMIRPFFQIFSPWYWAETTWWDRLAVAYNVGDAYYTFGLGWFIKRAIPAAWFLVIDYFNHYRDGEVHVGPDPLSNDFMEHQMATSQNVVFNLWLYKNYPTAHSLLTFGLDRQIEHHLFPTLKLQQLAEAGEKLVVKPRVHILGWRSWLSIMTEFV